MRDSGWYDCEKLDPMKKKGTPRLKELAYQLNWALDKHGAPKVAVIEGYSFGSGGKMCHIGEWGGVLRLELMKRGITKIWSVPPSTLKKFVIGHAKPGKSGKDVMLLKTFQRWGADFDDHDLSDAYGLAHAGYILEGTGGTKTDITNLSKASYEKW